MSFSHRAQDFSRRWINVNTSLTLIQRQYVIDVDSTSQQRRVSSGLALQRPNSITAEVDRIS